MVTYFKAWLIQRTNSVTGELQWLITTRKQQPVTMLGGLDISASYSLFEPNKPKVASKIHSIYLNDATDEIIAQMKQHASGNVFYLGVPASDDEPVQVITPAEYQSMQDSDTTSLEQESIPA
tara:strand:+ start:178 stop:543 length:366 start_codon:yes stop_codon:yes gene_type:complete